MKGWLPVLVSLSVLVPAAVLAAGSPQEPGGGLPLPAGPDFQVSTGSQGPQLYVDVAQDTAGDTAFVWIDGNTAPPTIQGRVFDPSGAPLGLSFIVGIESQPISLPRVAMTPLGEIAVTWGNPHSIFVRRFDRLGRPLGAVNVTQQITADAVLAPDVAVDPAGNATVVWAVSRFEGDVILLQRFNAANQLQGPVEVVSPVTFNGRNNPRIVANAAGSLLVSWDDFRTGNFPDVWARRYDGPSRTWGAEVRVNPSGPGVQQGSAPILYPEGDGAVVYGDRTEGMLLVRRLDAAGAPAGDPLPIGPLGSDPYPDAATGPDGTTLAVWQGGGELVRARFLDRSLNLLGNELAVSSVQNDGEFQPAAAAGGLGSFAVAWTSGAPFAPFPFFPPANGRDGSDLGVFAQRFKAATVCNAGSDTLCLADARFQARVSWRNPYTGETGTGKTLPLTGDTGAFWFFSPDNLELMIKVLDGTPVNGHFWVYYGALSNVEYTVSVTDTLTGTVKTYHNEPFQLASRADVSAFPSAPAAPLAAKALTAPPAPAALEAPAEGDCAASPAGLCLTRQRFQVQVDFTDPRTGIAGPARAVPLTVDTGVFWFFSPDNLELMVKVLDGTAVNGHFWVFYGALSDVEYTITVTDTVTGQRRTYHNALHHLASGSDVTAF
jgi:hypothetical protein